MSWRRGLLLLFTCVQAATAEPASAPETIEISERFAPAVAPTLQASERAALADGEVVVREIPPSDMDSLGIEVMALVEAPPARVWAVMADCDAYDEFMPRVTLAVVRDRVGVQHTCELVLDLPTPLGDQHTETRQEQRRLADGGYQRRWTLLPGDWSYHRNDGSWTVHPHGDGSHSLLVNRMDARPKSRVPLWLLRAAQVREAPNTFAAIRARVAKAP